MIYKCVCDYTFILNVALLSLTSGVSVCPEEHPPRWGDYILFSCVSFSTQDPTLGVCFEHFNSPKQGQSMANSVMEQRGEESSLKKNLDKMRRCFFSFFFFSFFFGLHFQYVGMSLKLTAPSKNGKFTDKEKKKAREVPRASGRSKCLANR